MNGAPAWHRLGPRTPVWFLSVPPPPTFRPPQTLCASSFLGGNFSKSSAIYHEQVAKNVHGFLPVVSLTSDFQRRLEYSPGGGSACLLTSSQTEGDCCLLRVDLMCLVDVSPLDTPQKLALFPQGRDLSASSHSRELSVEGCVKSGKYTCDFGGVWASQGFWTLMPECPQAFTTFINVISALASVAVPFASCCPAKNDSGCRSLVPQQTCHFLDFN